jgi:hypothetical protein
VLRFRCPFWRPSRFERLSFFPQSPFHDSPVGTSPYRPCDVSVFGALWVREQNFHFSAPFDNAEDAFAVAFAVGKRTILDVINSGSLGNVA